MNGDNPIPKIPSYSELMTERAQLLATIESMKNTQKLDRELQQIHYEVESRWAWNHISVDAVDLLSELSKAPQPG